MLDPELRRFGSHEGERELMSRGVSSEEGEEQEEEAKKATIDACVVSGLFPLCFPLFSPAAARGVQDDI